MGQHISASKSAGLLKLYLQGLSQTEIAQKLHISQGTVSMHLSNFKTQAEELGLKQAAEENGVDMNVVEDLHSLAMDLKEAKVTVGEVKGAVAVETLLQHLGIGYEEYKPLLETCKKMQSGGFLAAAVGLSQLEETTGKGPEEILDQVVTAQQKLGQTMEQLEMAQAKLATLKKDIDATGEKKKQAEQALAGHMKQMAMDEKRLKLVEGLALALKAAGIGDEALQDFIQRQQALNKAGIGLDTFTEILGNTKIVTSQDGGKELLKTVSDYGGLVGALNGLHLKVEAFEKQVAGLEQLVELKDKTKEEVAKLKGERAGLETLVVGLQGQKQELDQVHADLANGKNRLEKVKGEIESLDDKKTKLTQNVQELGEGASFLADEIKSREQQLGHLNDLELHYQNEIAQMGAKVTQEQERWDIFESFLGFVQSSSYEDLQKFVEGVPCLVKIIKKGCYSPEFLKEKLLTDLAGPGLQILKCTSCQARFSVDKPPQMSEYQCPSCMSYPHVTVDKDALTILKTALSPGKVIKIKLPVAEPRKPEDKVDD